MHRAVWIVAVVVVAGIAFAGGWLAEAYVKGNGSGSSSPPAVVRNTTLTIAGAGTLGTLFPEAANALVNSTPGISAPTAGQTYEGSLLALAAVNATSAAYDVAAAADYRLIPRLLEPSHASWEAIFATTPEVLAYDPSTPAFTGINTTNWPAKLESSGVYLGVANATTDPNGYNGIFVLELEGQLQNGSLSTVYSHFYTTPVGSLAAPNPATTKVEPETQAATLLASGTVNAFIIYRSYAVAHHLSFVNFTSEVGLGNLSSSAIAFDGQASTSIPTTTGALLKISGAPVAFAVTVPKTAANSSLGLAFVQLLLSPQGQALQLTNGFSPIVPAWSDAPGAVPSWLKPDVTAIPAGLPSV